MYISRLFCSLYFQINLVKTASRVNLKILKVNILSVLIVSGLRISFHFLRSIFILFFRSNCICRLSCPPHLHWKGFRRDRAHIHHARFILFNQCLCFHFGYVEELKMFFEKFRHSRVKDDIESIPVRVFVSVSVFFFFLCVCRCVCVSVCLWMDECSKVSIIVDICIFCCPASIAIVSQCVDLISYRRGGGSHCVRKSSTALERFRYTRACRYRYDI